MQNEGKKQRLHHHIRKHRKKYVRFFAFFVFLVIYSVVEDIIAIAIHGIEFNIIMLINVVMIAIAFTAISEITETIYKKEEEEIKEYERKVEKAIKKEEKFIENEERIIKNKIRKL